MIGNTMEIRSVNFHPGLVSELLGSTSATAFMIPGMWTVVMKLFLIVAQSQIFLPSDSHDNDLKLSILLTQCTAVALSVRTVKCVS